MKITLKQAMDAIKAAGCTIETKMPISHFNTGAADPLSSIVFVAHVPISKLNDDKEYDA